MEGILSGNRLKSLSDCFKECLRSSGLGTAQELFDLAPHFFDGIEVRRISRQKDGFGSHLTNKFKGVIVFMGGKIVHDHQISGPEGRA